MNQSPSASAQRVANLIARAKVAGWEVQCEFGGFWLTRWGRDMKFETVDEAERWLVQVTGRTSACAREIARQRVESDAPLFAEVIG